MYLSSNIDQRDNNLNLIRSIAAIVVIISHSYPLLYGKGNYDFLYNRLGITLGEVAVDVFFLISGFLISISLVSKKSLFYYFIARFTRIYPAMIVMLIFTIFFLGLTQTSLNTLSFLLHKETLFYFYKNAVIIFGGYNRLPGLFTGNPYPTSVNGSLWTILWEVRFYFILAFIYTISRILKNFKFNILILASFLSVIFFGLISIFLKDIYILPNWIYIFYKLGYFFFLGSLISILRFKVNFTWVYFFGWVLLFILSSYLNIVVFQLVYFLGLGYLVFFFAFIPKGFIRKFNHIGDYSYGLYIYSFPIQQTIVSIDSDINIFTMIFLSITFSLIVAFFSWNYIEKYFICNTNRFYNKLSSYNLRYNKEKSE